MSGAHKLDTLPDPFATVRALNKMRAAGFSLTVDGGGLIVTPASGLSDAQRAYIRAYRTALVALLLDAETLYSALAQAGSAGLAWLEGTPGWDGDRLLAAGEVLYTSGRMVSVYGRRYLKEHTPPIPDFAQDTISDISPDAISGYGADSLVIPMDKTPDIPSPTSTVIPMKREAYEERAAELQAQGGSPWNANARADEKNGESVW